jgi:hypothetical protein
MNTTNTSDRSWIGGVILIVIGLVLLAEQLFELSGWMVLGALSALFLALSIGTRKWGYVVPGMILGGLAIGLGFEEAGYGANGAAVVLGLSAGFIAIYVVNAFTDRPAHWWPLIPGGILAVVGGSMVVGPETAETVGRLWPIALIVAGLLALLGRRRSSRLTRS